jgi:hypothetical protein
MLMIDSTFQLVTPLLAGEAQEPLWFLPGISTPPFIGFLKKLFDQNNQNSLIIRHRGGFVKRKKGTL